MKRKAARKLCAAVFASLLAGTATLALPAVAHADPPPPCYGSSCNGKDPQATGCAGTFFTSTVASFNIDSGAVTVTLRYSDWCHANWATVYVHDILPPDGGEFWVQNANTDAQYYGFDTQATGGYWTNMVNGVPLARSCVNDNESYPDPKHPGCTGWH